MKSSLFSSFGFGYVAIALVALGGCGVIAGLDDFKDAPPVAAGGGGTGGSSSSATTGGMGGEGGAPAICGNGLLESGEECDGAMLDHATCMNCKVVCDVNWANWEPMPANGCEADTLADKQHCGSCSRDCQETNCIIGVCAPRTVAGDEAGVRAIAATEDAVYWANGADGRIRKFDIKADGSTTIATGFMSPSTIAVDDTYVFVGSGGDYTIKRMKHDGSELTTLATDMPNPPSSIAVYQDYVYWTTYAPGSPPKGNLYRVPKAGGMFTKLPMADAPSSALVTDGTNVYYGNQGWKVGSAPIILDKEDMPLWNSDGRARGMAIDPTNKWLYWSTEKGAIWKIKSGGGTAAKLIDNLGAMSSADLAFDNDTLYVQAAGIKQIFSLSLSSGTKTVLAITDGGVGNIAVTSTHVYWSDSVNTTVSRVVR